MTLDRQIFKKQSIQSSFQDSLGSNSPLASLFNLCITNTPRYSQLCNPRIFIPMNNMSINIYRHTLITYSELLIRTSTLTS